MTIGSKAEDRFREAFKFIREMPKSKERDDILLKVIEAAMKIGGWKEVTLVEDL